MAIQVNKLKKLNHVLDEEYQITHILEGYQVSTALLWSNSRLTEEQVQH